MTIRIIRCGCIEWDVMLSKDNDTALAELLVSELENQEETVEDIQIIKITEHGSGYVASGCRQAEFEELQEIMGYTGFGRQSFPNFYAYTEDRVYFKRVYDGSERVCSLPRNPTDEAPRAFGG